MLIAHMMTPFVFRACIDPSTHIAHPLYFLFYNRGGGTATFAIVAMVPPHSNKHTTTHVDKHSTLLKLHPNVFIYIFSYLDFSQVHRLFPRMTLALHSVKIYV